MPNPEYNKRIPYGCASTEARTTIGRERRRGIAVRELAEVLNILLEEDRDSGVSVEKFAYFVRELQRLKDIIGDCHPLRIEYQTRDGFTYTLNQVLEKLVQDFKTGLHYIKKRGLRTVKLKAGVRRDVIFLINELENIIPNVLA
jgi:hypothetical protein